MSRAVVTRAHRFRLAVNAAEDARLNDFARGRQKAWNWALSTLGDVWGLDRAADRLRALDQAGQPYRHVDKFTLITLFTQQKESLGWPSGVPSRVSEYAFEDLMGSVAAFLAARTSGSSRKVGFPKSIPARDANTFTVRGCIGLSPDRRGHKGTISLPLLPPLRVCGSTSHLLHQMSEFDGRIKEVTVSRASGHWYASVLLERLAQRCLVDPATLQPEDSAGMDLGITTYATFSDGTAIPNPRFATSPAAKRHERHRARGVGRKQSVRDLAHKAIGVMPPKSNRQIDSEGDLVSYRGRQRNRRTTFAAQSAAAVFPWFKVLGAEILAVGNMVKNHCLARSISDAGWSSYIKALESRAEDQGCLLVKADRFFASSQICSNCGYQNKAVKSLKVRSWVCPICGAFQLRDPNAALNLKPTVGQISLAHQAQLDKMSKYEKGKQKRSERASAAAKTKAVNAAAGKERSTRRQAARLATAAAGSSPRPTHLSPCPTQLSPIMPVLGRYRTSVDQIPGETRNRAWRAGKTGSASAARNPIGSLLSEEARTAPAEGHYGSTAPPPDPFVHK